MSDIFDWPVSLIPTEMTWALESNSKVFMSPFTGDQQVVGFPGSRWRTTLTFSDVMGDKRLQLETLLFQLDGMANRVRLWDFAARLVGSPQPVYGAPVVSVANQQGSLLITSGWTANTTVLRLGSWISVNGELKRIAADVQSDNAGMATLRIVPMLRSAPPVGTAIDVARPCGVFRMADNNQAKSARKAGYQIQGSVSVDFVETWSQ